MFLAATSPLFRSFVVTARSESNQVGFSSGIRPIFQTNDAAGSGNSVIFDGKRYNTSNDNQFKAWTEHVLAIGRAWLAEQDPREAQEKNNPPSTTDGPTFAGRNPFTEAQFGLGGYTYPIDTLREMSESFFVSTAKTRIRNLFKTDPTELGIDMVQKALTIAEERGINLDDLAKQSGTTLKAIQDKLSSGAPKE